MNRQTKDVEFYLDIQRLVFTTLQKVAPYESDKLDKWKDECALGEPFLFTNEGGQQVVWHDQEKLRSFLISALSKKTA